MAADLHTTAIDIAGHRLELRRNHIAEVAADHPHRFDVDGGMVGLVDDDQAEAIAVLIRLANEALAAEHDRAIYGRPTR